MACGCNKKLKSKEAIKKVEEAKNKNKLSSSLTRNIIATKRKIKIGKK